MSTRRSVIALAAALGLGAACHSRPPAVSLSRAPAPSPARSAGPVSPPPVPRTAVARSASPAPLSEADRFGRESLADLNAERPLGDAFFDYNQTALRDDARSALERDAEWLKKWTGTKIRVEGHCDERGTAEYNLALGEKRAAVVRSYLMSLGVDGNRVETVSMGKEAPFCTGDTEACWSQNRRGHFLITAK